MILERTEGAIILIQNYERHEIYHQQKTVEMLTNPGIPNEQKMKHLGIIRAISNSLFLIDNIDALN